MMLTRCLLLMTAIAVNTLIAGQPIPVQGDTPIDESQQEATMDMVSVEPALVQEEGQVGEQELPTVDGEPVLYKTQEEEPVVTMAMVSENPPFVEGDGGDQKGGSIEGGEQELPVMTAAGEPVLYGSIDEGEPVLTAGETFPPYMEYDGGDQVYYMNMVPEEQVDYLADEPPLLMYSTAGDPVAMEQTSNGALCAVMYGCCEEDCCGAGTSWQSPFCTIDPDSTGFNGTYSSAYGEGCIDRVCCEKGCCSPDTEYDDGTAECVPKGTAQGSKAAPKRPFYPEKDLAIPAPCPLPAPGTICTKEYEPVVCGDCEYDNQCLATAANPDFTSDTCANAGKLGCPVSNGSCAEIYAPVVCGDCEYSNQCEASAADPSFTSDTCMDKEISAEPAPTEPEGDTGLVKIDGECKGSEDCDSGYCFLIVGSGNPGICSCNPAMNTGCDENYECVGMKQITAARGVTYDVEPRPECRLPYGAACSPDDPKACLTGVCDGQTGSCACNSKTNYPCDIEGGEKCQLVNGSSICTNDPQGSLGLSEIGMPCTASEECDTGYCFQTRGSQFCSCNPETAAGCTGEEVCASSEDLMFAQGVADAPPGCFLPSGAKCDPVENKCLSASCDETTFQCACNPFSNWPCVIERGEICASDGGGYVCMPPLMAGGKPEPQGEGPFEVGQPCKVDEDCVTGNCFYGFQPAGTPGTCSCNDETNAGCSGEEICASSSDLEETQYLADASPGCFLPHDADCNPSEYNCLSGICDKTTLKCTCNTLSNWPCTKSGEVCVLDESNIFVCQ